MWAWIMLRKQLTGDKILTHKFQEIIKYPAVDKINHESYPYQWEWLGPGGPPGLQNRCRVALRTVVGSTPIHSRLILSLGYLLFSKNFENTSQYFLILSCQSRLH